MPYLDDREDKCIKTPLLLNRVSSLLSFLLSFLLSVLFSLFLIFRSAFSLFDSSDSLPLSGCRWKVFLLY